MSDSKQIAFAMKDKVFGEELSPSNLTLPLLSEFVEQVITYIKGTSRPDLSEVKTVIKKGSLAVVAENEAGILNDAYEDYLLVSKKSDLDLIDPVRARIIETWQSEARKNQDRVYELYVGNETNDLPTLTISYDTDFKPRRETWVDVELYLYGRVYDLGGKNKPNVHIELENGSTITLGTKESVLIGDSENRLYKDQLVRVKARKNIKTGKLKDERLVSFEHYEPVFREDEFERISKKARIAWRSVVSSSLWVEKLRGNV
jgi:hypothetical protein